MSEEPPAPEEDLQENPIEDSPLEAPQSAPPTEALRNWKRPSYALLGGCALLAIGIWQAVHVSRGGKPWFQFTPAPRSPSVLRSGQRQVLGQTLISTDPIRTYLDRAKQGLTEQEVRWIVDDFLAAGLDVEERSLKGFRRHKQQVWYLEALADALQLSPEQKNQARKTLDDLLDQDLAAQNIGIASLSGDQSPTTTIPESVTISPQAPAKVWLYRYACAPWKLCTLTNAQEKLTMKSWATSPNGALKPLSDSSSTEATVPWLQSAAAIQDPLSGNLVEFPIPRGSSFEFGNETPLTRLTHEGCLTLPDILPLSGDQKIWEHRGDTLAQARLLHPSQLKLALLLEPQLAFKLLAQLDPQPTTTPAPDTAEKTPGTVPAEEESIPETPVDPTPQPDPDSGR